MAKSPDPSLRAMRLLSEDVTAAIARGDLPAEAMADLKRLIDDARLRLWAAMETASSGDPAWAQEFWLQRAADMCHSVIQRLDKGELDGSSARAADLRATAERMAASLGRGR